MLPATTLSAADPWIVNAAPFIGLAKIGRLELLHSALAPGRGVFLPETVYREIGAGPAADPACRALANLTALGITLLPPVTASACVTVFTLDAGEAAVLTEALARPGSLCVIDDGPGRRAAKALGLDVTGTVGVLWQSRQEGRLTALAPELRALQAAGLYLPNETALRGLLTAFGETWP